MDQAVELRRQRIGGLIHDVSSDLQQIFTALFAYSKSRRGLIFKSTVVGTLLWLLIGAASGFYLNQTKLLPMLNPMQTYLVTLGGACILSVLLILFVFKLMAKRWHRKQLENIDTYGKIRSNERVEEVTNNYIRKHPYSQSKTRGRG